MTIDVRNRKLKVMTVMNEVVTKSKRNSVRQKQSECSDTSILAFSSDALERKKNNEKQALC